LCADHACLFHYQDDGPHGLHPVFRAALLARQWDHARQLALGLYANDWVWREHDFVQRVVLLADHSVRLLARVVGCQEGSGHRSCGAEGSGPGWEPLSSKDRVESLTYCASSAARGKDPIAAGLDGGVNECC